MSRIIRFHQFGAADVLKIEERQSPTPAAGEVLIGVEALGVSWYDVLWRQNLAPDQPKLPAGIGYELAGVVEAVGSEVTQFKVGDRVAYGSGPLGAYSDVHVLPEANLVRLPDAISFEQAAGVMLKGLTVQYLLRQTYRVEAGQTILWHAAAGGVGLIACQWAKALGATVIGTVSTEIKAELARQHMGIRQRMAPVPAGHRAGQVAIEVQEEGAGQMSLAVNLLAIADIREQVAAIEDAPVWVVSDALPASRN